MQTKLCKLLGYFWISARAFHLLRDLLLETLNLQLARLTDTALIEWIAPAEFDVASRLLRLCTLLPTPAGEAFVRRSRLNISIRNSAGQNFLEQCQPGSVSRCPLNFRYYCIFIWIQSGRR